MKYNLTTLKIYFKQGRKFKFFCQIGLKYRKIVFKYWKYILNTSKLVSKYIWFGKGPQQQTTHCWVDWLGANCRWPNCWGSQYSFDDKYTLLYELDTLQLMYSTVLNVNILRWARYTKLSLSQHCLLSLNYSLLNSSTSSGKKVPRYWIPHHDSQKQVRIRFVPIDFWMTFFKPFVRIFRCSFLLCVYSIFLLKSYKWRKLWKKEKGTILKS